MTFTKEEIIREAESNGVKFIRLQFTDLFGNLKNVEIPRSQLPKALNNDMMFDGSSIEGFTRIEESDMYLYPDLSTWLVLPWDLEGGAKVARLICDVYTSNKQPFSGDPRGILKSVLKEIADLGFSVNVGPEPEFFLFKRDEKGASTLVPNDQGGYFDLSPFDLGENCRRDIVTTLEDMGFEVEASHHEVAVGQHEIDFKYDEALKTADSIQTFKLVVKNIAQKHGLNATFMPKPIFGINGSGMHTHISLFDTMNNNAFYDEATSNGLSDLANRFMAGVLYHAKANAAITNPTVNSYKRLVPGYEAPVYIAWSESNRSCMIRIPASRGMGTRIEVRNPDPATNPYLALAVLLRAGLEGIKGKYNLPKENKQNLYHLTPEEKVELGIDTLPGSLKEALDAAENDALIKNVLGEHAFSHFLDGKRVEWEEYILHVSDWETKKFLNL